MNEKTTRALHVLLAILVALAGVFGGAQALVARAGEPAADRHQSEPQLTEIRITPAEVTLLVTLHNAFKAAGYDQYGDPFPLTDPQWAATGGSIFVPPYGTGASYTAEQVGEWEITCSEGGVTGTGSIHILAGTLDRIEVTPEEVTLTEGLTKQFTAKGISSEGAEVDVHSETKWTATGGDINLYGGLYTATTIGDFVVMATMSSHGLSDTADVHVVPGDLDRIEVTPNDVTLRVGEIYQVTATGYDAAGNEIDIDPNWSADGGEITKEGLYTATTAGDFTVTVWVNGSPVTGTATMHVIEGDLDRIEVMPDDVTLRVGETQQFIATGYDAAGNEVPIDPIWSATGGVITQEGLYTAGGLPGNFRVIAQVGVIQRRVPVRVVGQLPPNLAYGESWCLHFGYPGTFPYYDGHNFANRGIVEVKPPTSTLTMAQGVALSGVEGTLGVTVPVFITASGFYPPTITINVSHTVCWTNVDTTTHAMGDAAQQSNVHAIRGGVPYEVCLPLVLR